MSQTALGCEVAEVPKALEVLHPQHASGDLVAEGPVDVHGLIKRPFRMATG